MRDIALPLLLIPDFAFDDERTAEANLFEPFHKQRDIGLALA
jgi:hypothetical protein